MRRKLCLGRESRLLWLLGNEPGARGLGLRMAYGENRKFLGDRMVMYCRVMIPPLNHYSGLW